jgi:hypothetical protein
LRSILALPSPTMLLVGCCLIRARLRMRSPNSVRHWSSILRILMPCCGYIWQARAPEPGPPLRNSRLTRSALRPLAGPTLSSNCFSAAGRPKLLSPLPLIPATVVKPSSIPANGTFCEATVPRQ